MIKLIKAVFILWAISVVWIFCDSCSTNTEIPESDYIDVEGQVLCYPSVNIGDRVEFWTNEELHGENYRAIWLHDKYAHKWFKIVNIDSDKMGYWHWGDYYDGNEGDVKICGL